MAELPIGQLIRLHRIDRKLSTVYVATHVGITARYMEMIEAGTKTPSLPTLRKIAKVLHLRTSALIGELPSEDHAGPVSPLLVAAERALFTYNTVTLTGRETLPEISELTDRVSAAWATWFTSPTKYTDVLDVLPDLIVDVERAAHAYGHSREICRQASELYQLARPVFKHVGRGDLARLLADRAMRHAELTEDPALIAAASWNLAQSMLSGDMPEGALDMSMLAIEQLEPLLADGSPELVSVYGAHLQAAAIASVRVGDPWRGRELLRGPARRAAAKVGDSLNHHHMVFGPSNVAMHMMSLACEAGEISDALRLADEVDHAAMPSLERRTTFLYTVARCYEQRNNDTGVLVHLKMAHRECPQDFQHKRMVRNMVSSLARRARPSFASEVREFAGTVGLLGD